MRWRLLAVRFRFCAWMCIHIRVGRQTARRTRGALGTRHDACDRPYGQALAEPTHALNVGSEPFLRRCVRSTVRGGENSKLAGSSSISPKRAGRGETDGRRADRLTDGESLAAEPHSPHLNTPFTGRHAMGAAPSRSWPGGVAGRRAGRLEAEREIQAASRFALRGEEQERRKATAGRSKTGLRHASTQSHSNSTFSQTAKDPIFSAHPRG